MKYFSTDGITFDYGTPQPDFSKAIGQAIRNFKLRAGDKIWVQADGVTCAMRFVVTEAMRKG